MRTNAFYDQNIIEQVREATDIVDIIGESVKLVRRGSNYLGLCPFHNEKTPSFSVNPADQFFHCFGCGESGNVFTFLMKYENMSFPDAVRHLAERAGIALPEREFSAADKAERDMRTRLYEINKAAAIYFYRALRSEHGKTALDYFEKRELSPGTMKSFGLGYSLSYRDDLYKYLKGLPENNYNDELLKKSGLFRFDEKYGMSDLFWNRVMFPIMDLNGKVIAFGGRVMGDGEPKYMNSYEGPVFDKSRNMYGMHLARKSRRKYFILCEGYFDVIALHQAGFDCAVATLGTALTSGHCSLLKRQARDEKKIYVCYDSDGAGVKAALRAIPMLRSAGLETRVINMSPHKDSDEFIKALGREEFEKRIEEAENGFLYMVRKTSEKYDLSDPAGKTAFVGEMAHLMLMLSEGVERDSYLSKLSELYHVSEKNLSGAIIKEAQKETAFGKKRRIEDNDSSGPPDEPAGTGGKSSGGRTGGSLGKTGSMKEQAAEGIREAQRLFLSRIAGHPSLLSQIEDVISAEDFQDEVHAALFEELTKEIKALGTVNPARLINIFSDVEQQSEAGRIFGKAAAGDTGDEKTLEKAFSETVIKVKQEHIDFLARGDDAAESATFRKLMDERKKLEKIKTRHFHIV